MPRENHRRRRSDFECSGPVPRGRFNPYARPHSVTDARSVTDEQARNARERLRRILDNLGQRANNPHTEAGAVEEQEAREILDSLTIIDQHRQQRLEQHLEEARRERQEDEETRRRRRGRRECPIRARSLQSFSRLLQMPAMRRQQPQEPTLPPLSANSTTDMTLAPAPSADGQPTWEFKDWYDGEYLDQLVSDYLHPEGQELVQEVTRQVEQLNLASNLTQEVTGLGEQPVLAHDPMVSSEGPMVGGYGPTVGGLDEEPNGERQGDDHQLPQ